MVAVALLTEEDLERLGSGFSRAWPVDTSPRFGGLSVQIDTADRDLRRARDRERRVSQQVESAALAPNCRPAAEEGPDPASWRSRVWLVRAAANAPEAAIRRTRTVP